MLRDLPIAWLQLSHDKTRLLVAITGVVFANVLMFMQLALQDALYESTTVIQNSLRADLVLINSKSESTSAMRSFSRRRLYQALGYKGVASVAPLYLGTANWKNPWDGTSRLILVLGCDPLADTLSLPGFEANRPLLNRPDVILFDRLSRAEFGPVGETWDHKQNIAVELNNHRMEVGGVTAMGASFAANGNVITSDRGFSRIFPNRPAGVIDVGLIRLEPGADIGILKRSLQTSFAERFLVLTPAEFAALERNYWEKSTAVGFIFGQGVVLGFVVGLVIVSQILYADVSRHLPEYATLKAIGYTDSCLFGFVLQEALILSVAGYLPGVILAILLGRITANATSLPLAMHGSRAALVFGLTVVMCALSGTVAVRKLSSADPAEVF